MEVWSILQIIDQYGSFAFYVIFVFFKIIVRYKLKKYSFILVFVNNIVQYVLTTLTNLTVQYWNAKQVMNL